MEKGFIFMVTQGSQQKVDCLIFTIYLTVEAVLDGTLTYRMLILHSVRIKGGTKFNLTTYPRLTNSII